MAAIVNLNAFRISSEPKFSEDGRRCEFSVMSATKYYNGQYLKLFVDAFDEECSKIRRLKAKKGSLVDIIAEMSPYVRNGKEGIGYKVMSFNYSVIPDLSESGSKQTETKGDEPKESKDDKLRAAARFLANNPFA